MQSDTSPSSAAYLITPSDSTDLPTPIRMFTVATAGNVKVNLQNGATETWPLPSGPVPATNVKRIWSTGTTAVGFVGFP